MMRLFFIIAFVAVSFGVKGQVGDVFPMFVGETLKGQVVDLPESVSGKFSLIGIAYSKKSQDEFESWVSPVYNKFIAKTGMLDDLYDVDPYFIALFSGAKKSAMEGVMKRMEAKSDQRIFPYVLFYKGAIDFYKEKLSLNDKSKAYVFLLDGAGKIVYATSGSFTSKKMEAIEKLILEE